MANAKAKDAKIGRPSLTANSIPQIFYKHYPSFANGALNITELSRLESFNQL